MNRVTVFLSFICIVVAAGAAFAGYKFAPGPNHLLARQLAIQSQLNQVDDAQILFLGDSIVERADIRRVCSPDTLNAGVSGAKVEDVLNIASTLKLERIHHVIIAVGVNDAKTGARSPIKQVISDYKALIELVASSGSHVTVATVAPTSVEGTNDYSREYITLFNDELVELAKANNVDLIDLSALGSDRGLLPTSDASDGVHLTGEGYARWAAIVSPHCL